MRIEKDKKLIVFDGCGNFVISKNENALELVGFGTDPASIQNFVIYHQPKNFKSWIELIKALYKFMK